jgi:hypothetical protein
MGRGVLGGGGMVYTVGMKDTCINMWDYDRHIAYLHGYVEYLGGYVGCLIGYVGCWTGLWDAWTDM